MPTSTPDDRALIDSAPLSDDLRDLARRGEVRHYVKGTRLIDEGDRGDTIFIILAGLLRVHTVNPETLREFTFGEYEPGEYVGEMSLDGGCRSASVTAMKDTACARVQRPTLEAFVAERPRFAFELLAKVIGRARAATLTLKQVALNSCYGRVKAFLESRAVLQADGTWLVTGSPTDLRIAQHVGCTREMVSRIMSQLLAGAYIERLRRPSRLRILRKLPPRW